MNKLRKVSDAFVNTILVVLVTFWIAIVLTAFVYAIFLGLPWSLIPCCAFVLVFMWFYHMDDLP